MQLKIYRKDCKYLIKTYGHPDFAERDDDFDTLLFYDNSNEKVKEILLDIIETIVIVGYYNLGNIKHITERDIEMDARLKEIIIKYNIALK